MRTTLALDDDLLEKATALTGVAEKSALVREALRALIQRESAKRLAQLGGTMPGLQDVPRRQGSAR
jgi:Arc/MetJ family transcription regulator